MEHESLRFYQYYTADRPFLSKVFDPHSNDFGTYQARELSYFFDALNVRVYQGIARVAPDFFVPPTSWVIPLLLSLVFTLGVRRTTRNLDWITALLLLGCYCSSFVFVSTLALFYRSGKPLMPVLILAFLFWVRHVEVKRRHNPSPGWRERSRDVSVAWILAVTLGLLDLQGVAYVSAAGAILVLHAVLTRRLVDVGVATILAAGGLQLYNRVLGPRVIHALNGYWPTFSYQDVPTQSLPVAPAIELLVGNVVVMLGGFWPLTLLVGMAAAGLAALCRVPDLERAALAPSRSARARVILYVGLAIAANILMFSLMIARHPAVHQMPDHHHWYYPLPWLSLVLFALAVGLNALWPGLRRGARRGLQVALLALICGNLASLPRLKDEMERGPWFSLVYPQSEWLKTFLRTGVIHPLLGENYKGFGTQIRELRGEVRQQTSGSNP